LEGGFVAAARYLLRHDSTRSIASSLVDVDIDALNAVLGVSSPVNAVGSVVVATSETNTSNVANSNSSSSSSTSTFIKDVAPAAFNSLLTSASALLKKDASKPDPSPSGSTAAAAGAPQESVVAAKTMISDFGKRMSVFGNSSLESLKKSSWMSSIVGGEAVPSSSGPAAGPTAAPAATKSVPSSGVNNDGRSPSPAFTIDDDDETADDGMGPREVDPNKINVSKTDQERAQALAMHRLAGLRKGDTVVIGRENLPGATLFPAVKFKVEEGTDLGTDGEPKQILVHRFLVVTRERFMVLDSHGGGVGSTATVKSNHHLTEVCLFGLSVTDPSTYI
jgi:hypothetical protein